MSHAPQIAEAPALPLRLSRQPVFDGSLEVMGYSLLMRSSDGRLDEKADVVLGTFASHYADRVVGGQQAFVRVGAGQLAQGVERVLPKARTVLEITDSTSGVTELLEIVTRLSDSGYTLALGDFALTREVVPLLNHVQYVKLDVGRFTNRQLVKQIKVLRRHELELVASNIHSHEQFELCRELGFDYFQGTFLCRPRDVKAEEVKVQRSAVMELLAKVNDPEAGVKEIVETIRRDGGLVVRLLRIVNSAFYGMNRKVHTTKQAISLLGLQRIRAWVALLAVANMEDKPSELLMTAMIRARMAELLAMETGVANSERYFVGGILSMLDAMMDRPMTDLVAELPLTQDMCAALLDRKGNMGKALHCIEAHERAVWSLVHFGGLSANQIQDCWLKSIDWAKQISVAVNRA
jgi:EAL and modified HD-GYP domain-containing signal transduction protein